MSHGKQWATLGVLDRVEQRPAGGNVVNARLQINLPALANVAKVGAAMTAEGWRLYDRGCQPPM